MEEKKETQSSRLLQEQAEYHCRLAQRKVRNVFGAQINMPVNLDSTGWNIFSKSGLGCYCQTLEVLRHYVSQEKMMALEAQVKQLGFQAAQDCERLTKDRTLTLQLLHKVGEEARRCVRMQGAPEK